MLVGKQACNRQRSRRPKEDTSSYCAEYTWPSTLSQPSQVGHASPENSAQAIGVPLHANHLHSGVAEQLASSVRVSQSVVQMPSMKVHLAPFGSLRATARHRHRCGKR